MSSWESESPASARHHLRARHPSELDEPEPMTHNEPRSTPLREGSIAVLTGAVYGVVHTLSGHPLDNLKARLQVDRRFHGETAWAAARKMWRLDGLTAFFRGCVPPLWGSAVYRAVMMAAYEGCYTFLDSLADDSPWRREGPLGVRPLVVASAVAAALCRVVVEAPIEQAKVMGQTGRPWQWRSLYRGVLPQAARTAAMLTLLFVPWDLAKQRTSLAAGPSGQFAVVSASAAGAYAVAWPLETLKNVAQAGLPTPGATLAQRLAFLGGASGLYRGAAPGVLCGGLRNGCAALAMNGVANPLATRMGLRDGARS